MSEIERLRRGFLGRATIGDQLRRHAQHTPAKAAIVYYGPGGTREVITYRDLNERANAFASHLDSLGVGRGDVVAMMSRNSPDYMAAWFGTLKLGAIFTGVNFTLTGSEIAYQINHSGARVLVAEDMCRAAVDAVRDELDGVDVFLSRSPADGARAAGWEPLEDVLSASAGEALFEVDENDPAMLVYTSGTTEHPKGVLISHRNYLASTTPAWTLALGLGPEVVWLFVMPFFTIAGLGSMTSIVGCGATIVLVHSIDPATALTIIRDERVTYMAQTPTFYLAMTQVDGFADADLAFLQRCITYGGTVPAHMIEAWQAASPGITWGTYWGQSELSQLGSVGWFTSLDDIPGGDPAWIGKPVPQLEIRVLDEDGNEADTGELVCRSPSVMLGYHRDDERTLHAFRDGWLHTEDVVRVDGDGNLFFVDRKKDVIKTGGMNVSSVEVERVVYRHPAVMEVAVVGVPDEYWSEAVTAFVVRKPDAEIDEEGLLEHCRGLLAGFKVPKAVRFVEALPKDVQGKTLKRELRAGAVTS